ncbi:hypothetical protein JR316_0012896 [Psilocybe cubensis]|uniref:Uncharacterized protein n=2 Tax=Psilocybe cubensis TaxID=181762 RepID=A0ACB8GGC5_PSICU|nr:hypothetical protein JR316_0012896 [Psilocybe cubensis]KAH9474437.1 hypothetical protein JR316_0012896 [Psilocybe cubensis]
MSTETPMSELKIQTVQPEPTPSPSTTQMAVSNLNTATTLAKPSHNRRRFQYLVYGLAKLIMDMLAGLGIALVYGIPAVIIICLGIVVFVGLPFAFGAAYGAVAMLIGNGILRAAHLAHYTNNASAAAIGATGAVIAALALGLLLQFFQKPNEERPTPWYVTMCTTVVVHTLSGAIGTSILQRHHVDLGGIDVLHATRAGALGGAILGPGSILLVPVILAGLGIILSPLWLAMTMGLRWEFHRFPACKGASEKLPSSMSNERLIIDGPSRTDDAGGSYKHIRTDRRLVSGISREYESLINGPCSGLGECPATMNNMMNQSFRANQLTTMKGITPKNRQLGEYR